MAVARFRGLCIDVDAIDAMTAFLSRVLGLSVGADDDGEPVLTGSSPQHRIWPCRVPEPKTVKNRVHLDLVATSLEPFDGLVRRSADGEFPWTVFEDPEGGEFCVFVRDEVPDYRLFEVVVDSADPPAIAAWWADVLGAASRAHRFGFSFLADVPDLPFDTFSFVPVPEPKTVKNRIHWDVEVAPDGVAALEARGAVVLRRPDDDIAWTVLADPEGNEFCAFVVE